MSKYKTNKEKHPLYNSWVWMKRMSHRHELSSDWKDFWKFVNDVKERPTQFHQLYRINKGKGYSKENCIWKKVIPCKDRAAWMREYRKQNPDKFRQYELKTNYGITLKQFNYLFKKQNGVCAICGKEEHVLHLGKPRQMAVDHDHKTGKIRGLLCTNCNKLLGHSKDSVDTLQKAINYLISNLG